MTIEDLKALAEDMGDPVITITDCMDAGHCATGIAAWYRQHGFNAREAFRSGVRASEALATGDGLACQIVERTLLNKKKSEGDP